MNKRRSFKPELKARIVTQALTGQKTAAGTLPRASDQRELARALEAATARAGRARL